MLQYKSMNDKLKREESYFAPYPSFFNVLNNISEIDLVKYFDGWAILRPLLSKKHQIEEQRIIVGDGIKAILREIFDNIKDGEVVLTSNICYSFYVQYSEKKNIHLEFFNLTNSLEDSFLFDTEDCILKIKRFNPKVVIIASPNNPTGHSISPQDLEKILQVVDQQSLMVLDEAYFGFDKNYCEADFLALLKKYSNLLILRSFSKYYNLAGIRVGYGMCGKDVRQIINIEERCLGGNKVSEKLAVGAMKEEDYYEKLSDEIITNRIFLIINVNKTNNFKAYRSSASFVLIEFRSELKQALEIHFLKSPFTLHRFVGDTRIKVNIGNRKSVEWYMDSILNIDRNAKAV